MLKSIEVQINLMRTKSKHTLGNILFFLGIFFGLTLAFAMTWANFEAVFYYYVGTTYDAFSGLHCPSLMTRAEIVPITATFDNPTDQEAQPYYEVDISGLIPRQFENQIMVPPHQTKSVEWTVSANDIDYGSFVFVRLDIHPDAYHSERQAVCGIVVLSIPILSGGQVLALTLAISILGTVLGYGLWELTDDKLAHDFSSRYRSRQALGIVVLAAIFAGLMGWWLGGILFCILAVLLLVVMLRQAIA